MVDLDYRRDSSLWYEKELPADKAKLAEAYKLLESYSGIPKDEIDAHVTAVREKAFSIFQYPCIGLWRFLDMYLTSTPEYPTIILRLQAGDTLLDLGCCFAQILRQLAFDGVPSANLVGLDLRPEFVELGYELFRDEDKFAGRFVTGDILDPADAGLTSIDGQIDIVHAASFFHLFNWDDQVKVGERVVRFFRPTAKAWILGRQVGTSRPCTVEEHRYRGERTYTHNIATLQSLWNEIGERTGTQWKVTGELFNKSSFDYSAEIIRFAISKVR